MYVPHKFALSDAATDAALAQAEFAHLVTHAATGGLLVTPLPLMYDASRHALLGHVARANPHWKEAGAESVAIFAGPHAYVSPSFYATKSETGKVVPTWNYEVLTVHGRLVAHDDPDWVLALVTALTDRHEQGRGAPWHVSDAPETFTRAQLKAIVGIELPVDSVVGKTKMSQNQPERNRTGVVAGLRESAAASDHEVAERVESLGGDGAATGTTTPNARG